MIFLIWVVFSPSRARGTRFFFCDRAQNACKMFLLLLSSAIVKEGQKWTRSHSIFIDIGIDAHIDKASRGLLMSGISRLFLWGNEDDVLPEDKAV